MLGRRPEIRQARGALEKAESRFSSILGKILEIQQFWLSHVLNYKPQWIRYPAEARLAANVKYGFATKCRSAGGSEHLPPVPSPFIERIVPAATSNC